jgi:hypothetical protein
METRILVAPKVAVAGIKRKEQDLNGEEAARQPSPTPF